MSRVKRVLALVVVVGVSMTGAAALAQDDAIDLDVEDACTFTTTREIGKVFGTPVEGLLVRAAGGYDCSWNVAGGPDVPGGGRFQVIVLYPNFLVNQSSARTALEDQRAIDVLSEAEVVDVRKIGRNAYLNTTSGWIVVEASKKLTFQLNWIDSDPAADLTPRDAKKLKKFAKRLVERGPK